MNGVFGWKALQLIRDDASRLVDLMIYIPDQDGKSKDAEDRCESSLCTTSSRAVIR